MKSQRNLFLHFRPL